LRQQIPIRTFADWDEDRPGSCEADLVAHDGGIAVGEYCQTLLLTDVFSGWCDPRALPNNAQRWVHDALTEVAAELPFPLVGLDSDNGSEFINHHLVAFCESRNINWRVCTGLGSASFACCAQNHPVGVPARRGRRSFPKGSRIVKKLRCSGGHSPQAGPSP
jgi:hypothetical protein